MNDCHFGVSPVNYPDPDHTNAEICPGFPPPRAALRIILSNEGDTVYIDR